MKLTEHSKNKLLKSLSLYEVPKDYAEPIYNYLVYGFAPGSFFTSVLANEFMDAISRSHPANTIGALKNLVCWILNELPEGVAYGSYAIVDEWLTMTEQQRRAVLEHRRLIYTEQEEIMLILKGEPTHEPHLW